MEARARQMPLVVVGRYLGTVGLQDRAVANGAVTDAQGGADFLRRAHRGLAVSVYPDSDTIGVFAGDENDLVFERRTAVPWAHGEEGWNKAT